MNKFGLFTVLIALSACIKQEDVQFRNVKVNGIQPEYAVPVINSELKLDKLLNNQSVRNYVRSNADGYLSLFLENFDYSVDASKFVAFPPTILSSSNVQLSTSELSSFNAAVAGSTINSTVTTNLQFFAVYELDEVLFKTGNFRLDFKNNYPAQVQYTATFPDLKKNGISLVISGVLSAGGLDSKIVNIQDYIADFTRNTSGVYNELRMQISNEFTKGVTAATAIDDISVTAGFDNSTYRYVKGYFGTTSTSIPVVNIPIDVFTANQGTVNFENPKLQIHMRNELGIPLEITTLNPLNAKLKNGNTVNITGITPPVTVNKATSFTNPGITTIKLDKTNSNLATVVSGQPSEINIGASISSNPAGKIARNFVTDTSNIVLTGSFELPLWLSASGFGLRDTTNWDLGGIETKNVEWGELHFVFDNGFPIEVEVQAYPMVSSTGLVVDSIFNAQIQPLLPSAIVDGSGNVITKGFKVTDVRVTRAKLEKWKLAGVNAILYNIKLNTAAGGSQRVKFTSQQGLGIRLGVRAKLNGEF